MDDAVGSDGEAPAPRRRIRWPWLVAVALGVVLSITAVVIVLGVIDESRPIPDFPSLTAQPDPSLKGTIAYTAPTGCVRLISASGARQKDLYCLPKEDGSQIAKVGKEVGPQLVWRPDGRLEITMFRMDFAAMKDQKKAPPLVGAWQKIVNVETGAVEDVPAGQVPTALNRSSRKTVDPGGRRVVAVSDGLTGKVRIDLVEVAGTRTIMSAHGPGKYGYSLGAAFWSPNWQWVAADDGRILVVTTGKNPTTRILVTARGVRSGGAEGATFAVTGEDLLGP